MVWLIDDQNVVRELEHESDRAAALMAVAHLEHRLAETLKVAFEDLPKIRDRVFKGYGPLASLAAKIDVAALIGIFPQYLHRGLTTVREIRNDFAHSPNIVSFESQKIADLCKNFGAPVTERPYAMTYERALELVFVDATVEERNLLYTAAIFGGADTSRNRFMNFIKHALLTLYLISIIARKKREIAVDITSSYWPWPSRGDLTAGAAQSSLTE
jgi:hypothetical protein